MEEIYTTQEAEQSTTPAEMPKRSFKAIVKKITANKKACIVIAIVLLVVLAAVVTTSVLSGKSKGINFIKLAEGLDAAFPKAYYTVAPDGSYLKLDTNPTNNDKDIGKMTIAEAEEFISVQSATADAISFLNQGMGFSSALYQKMIETTWTMGRQSEEIGKIRVTWTYHPDKGLEVMYEKK